MNPTQQNLFVCSLESQPFTPKNGYGEQHYGLFVWIFICPLITVQLYSSFGFEIHNMRHEPLLRSGQCSLSLVQVLNLKYITYEVFDPTSLELTCSAWTHSLRSCQRCSVERVRPPPDDDVDLDVVWKSGKVRPLSDDKWLSWM